MQYYPWRCSRVFVIDLLWHDSFFAIILNKIQNRLTKRKHQINKAIQKDFINDNENDFDSQCRYKRCQCCDIQID